MGACTNIRRDYECIIVHLLYYIIFIIYFFIKSINTAEILMILQIETQSGGLSSSKGGFRRTDILHLKEKGRRGLQPLMRNIKIISKYCHT